MRDHTKLRAFEMADELVLEVYKETTGFPRVEVFGLSAQLRRAAVSIASNIVEGCARSTQNEYVRFLEIAYGSAREVEYQISLALRLGYLASQSTIELPAKSQKVSKTLCALIRSLQVR